MPEVIVKKRLGRRTGDWRFQLRRWFYRNRPQVAVVVAFVAACLFGLAVVSGGLSMSEANQRAKDDVTLPPA